MLVVVWGALALIVLLSLAFVRSATFGSRHRSELRRALTEQRENLIGALSRQLENEARRELAGDGLACAQAEMRRWLLFSQKAREAGDVDLCRVAYEKSEAAFGAVSLYLDAIDLAYRNPTDWRVNVRRFNDGILRHKSDGLGDYRDLHIGHVAIDRGAVALELYESIPQDGFDEDLSRALASRLGVAQDIDGEANMAQH